MPRFTFSQVDVFAPAPLLGNPVAVVHGADGLDDDHLAAFARWTNLSETTFLLAPTDPAADYRLRIFTPAGELPFAGYPTLGSAHAWLQAGGSPRRDRLIQECALGLIEIRSDRQGLAFRAPELLRSGPVAESIARQVLGALGVAADRVRRMAWADNGPGWIGVVLDSAETVLALDPDYVAIGDLAIGVLGPAPDGPVDFEVRAFDRHTREDPVTGSLNAAFARWLVPDGLLPRSYTVRQGTRVHRSGEVVVTTDPDDTIWVGGQCVTLVTGTLKLP